MYKTLMAAKKCMGTKVFLGRNERLFFRFPLLLSGIFL
jgi:hypothetical protein